MLSIFDFARSMSFAAIVTRLILAVICGGAVGMEREYKRRPAGFRTHILICLGAAMTTLTSQYLFLVMHLYTDIARLGAQVIAGIGFIGAGTIIVSKNKRIKGLTTAAGLWTTSIVGLACGAGYIECAVVAVIIILFAELVLSRLEYAIDNGYREINIFVEYTASSAINEIILLVNEKNCKIIDIEITTSENKEKGLYYSAFLNLKATKKISGEELQKIIKNIPQVTDVKALQD